MGTALARSEEQGLRAEHDALAARLAALLSVAFVRARRHRRVEDAEFARLRELRVLPGIDR